MCVCSVIGYFWGRISVWTSSLGTACAIGDKVVFSVGKWLISRSVVKVKVRVRQVVLMVRVMVRIRFSENECKSM